MGQRERGLYDKFVVRRTDGGSHLGQKHFDCAYFVLDLTHDKHAIAALEAYAVSCHIDGYVDLANDLHHKAQSMREQLTP
jgi:hypothetical protein